MTQSGTIPTVQVRGQAANKRVKFMVGGGLIALAIIYLIVTGIQSTAAYFLTIDELYTKGVALENRTVRVAGVVDADTIAFNNRELILNFDVMSETGERMSVVFNGPKPDQMRHGADAILEGTYDGELFVADSLLLKCPSRYEEGVIEEVQVDAVR